jgi:hypothetical protein
VGAPCHAALLTYGLCVHASLQADGDRRRAELEKARADKAEREAKALALVSVGPGFSRRPHSAHR